MYSAPGRLFAPKLIGSLIELSFLAVRVVDWLPTNKGPMIHVLDSILKGLSSWSSELWSPSTATVASLSSDSGKDLLVWKVGRPSSVRLSMTIGVWWCLTLSLSIHVR